MISETQIGPRVAGGWTGPINQSHDQDAKTSEAIRVEFQRLRAFIRQDLKEELRHALAETSEDSIKPALRKPGSIAPAKTASLDPIACSPETIVDDDIELLRLSSTENDLVACQSTNVVAIGTNERPRVGFASKVSQESSKFFDQGSSNKSNPRNCAGGLLQENVVAAAKRAGAKSVVTKVNTSQDESSVRRVVSNARKTVVAAFRTGVSIKSAGPLAMISDRLQEPLSWAEVFEIITLLAIIVNGIAFGVQTEYLAHQRTEEIPAYFLCLEAVFFAIFSSELLMRLSKERRDFFTGQQCQWNLFDTLLVLLQLFDLMMEATQLFSHGTNLSFLRMLRILRILRALRLVRLVRFLGDLNVVSSAIANSIRSLAGTLAMLFLIIYIFAIAFAGAANSHLIRLRDAGKNIENNPVEIWWSSLGRTVLSLYESILGGVDWDDLIQGLLEMHAGWAILFVCYITFMMLTMLNVITGIFVDSALKHAKQYQEKSFLAQMRHVFITTDTEHDGKISRQKFETEMHKPEFAWFVQDVGIEPREARLLFDLLDLDKSDDIEAEEFLAGMVRLRSRARFIDIMNLQSAIEQLLNPEVGSLFASRALGVGGTNGASQTPGYWGLSKA